MTGSFSPARNGAGTGLRCSCCKRGLGSKRPKWLGPPDILRKITFRAVPGVVWFPRQKRILSPVTPATKPSWAQQPRQRDRTDSRVPSRRKGDGPDGGEFFGRHDSIPGNELVQVQHHAATRSTPPPRRDPAPRSFRARVWQPPRDPAAAPPPVGDGFGQFTPLEITGQPRGQIRNTWSIVCRFHRRSREPPLGQGPRRLRRTGDRSATSTPATAFGTLAMGAGIPRVGRIKVANWGNGVARFMKIRAPPKRPSRSLTFQPLLPKPPITVLADCGGRTLGPPRLLESRPLAANALSRIASAASRRLD
ncbi:MAG: hypothetical protein Ct9H300mP1_02760 [Planctomycetaceae bacterium]|nr:MAG: hypothetical protein Ct9H300mP1_02760 [Planctomycetaceae bacterium]